MPILSKKCSRLFNDDVHEQMYDSVDRHLNSFNPIGFDVADVNKLLKGNSFSIMFHSLYCVGKMEVLCIACMLRIIYFICW